MKRRITGIAVHDTHNHTVRVRVMRVKQHPKYKKRFKTYKDFLVHDAMGFVKAGAELTIEETRPLSKTKRFRVVYTGKEFTQ